MFHYYWCQRTEFSTTNQKLFPRPLILWIVSEIFSDCYIYVITNPLPARTGCDSRSIFKRSLTNLNSEFSFSETDRLIKAKELSLPYYLLIAGRGLIGLILFPRVLVLCEMQCFVQDLNSCPSPTMITMDTSYLIAIYNKNYLLPSLGRIMNHYTTEIIEKYSSKNLMYSKSAETRPASL